MSDGGAGAIVQVVGAMAQHRLGRWVLMAGVAYSALLGLADPRNASTFFFVGGVIALICGVYALIAWFRKRSERAATRSFLMVLGFLVVATVAVVFAVFLLLKRRKKATTVVALPDVAELEALARQDAAA